MTPLAQTERALACFTAPNYVTLDETVRYPAILWPALLAETVAAYDVASFGLLGLLAMVA
jgi:hypothetical protein